MSGHTQEIRRVLVTGASGFIGRHLVESLSRGGIFVRALVREKSRAPDWEDGVEVVEGDVRDAMAMRDVAKGMDAVFHLAGKAHAIVESGEDEPQYRAVIVEGTRNLLESVSSWRCRTFIYFSSVKVFGEESSDCRDESRQPMPQAAYGRAKLEAENLVLRRGMEDGFKAVCLRLPLVYGPGNKGNLLRMLRAIDRGIFPPVSGPSNRRSMIHVENVVMAARLAAEHPSSGGRCYIITDERPYSTKELYDLFRRGLGRRPTAWGIPPRAIRWMGRIGDLIGYVRGKRFPFDSEAASRLLDSSWFSSGLISLELGYKPRRNFEDSVEEIISWYRRSGTRA